MTGKLRIIAGQWRGRRLTVPDRPGLRPTGDRARETLFNWLGPGIVGSRVLDLFAGTGALGLEAASRGASRVVMVERDRQAVDALRTGPLRWPGAECIELVQADALVWMEQAEGPFDLVLLDPPFGAGLLQSVLDCLEQRSSLLEARAKVYIESPPDETPDSWPAFLEPLRQKRQGGVVLSLLQRRAESHRRL